MISLKKYLDMDLSEENELLSTTLECYRSVLLAMGKSGSRACPGVSSDLPQKLVELSTGLSGDLSPKLMAETEKNVEAGLQQWSDRSSEYFKAKANELKELLMVLASTAESLAERDQRYAGQFTEFTSQLQTIANLEDLSQVRAALVKGAAQLKNRIDQMVQDSRKSVDQLRAEVTNYECKLKAVEELAVRDSLTGLVNRRGVEECIAWRISHNQPCCIMILDLNGFKLVNDRHGHAAGDSLLKQFSHELLSHTRTSDVVGRWGGDEFIVVLEGNMTGVNAQIDRIRKWVFGKYALQLGAGNDELKIDLSASIGTARWEPGQTTQQLVEVADAAMYREKHLTYAARV